MSAHPGADHGGDSKAPNNLTRNVLADQYDFKEVVEEMDNGGEGHRQGHGKEQRENRKE